jgi:hypothetical protein
MTVVLYNRGTYWGAFFYGFARMPEDVEIPLPFHGSAPLAKVKADLARRFPNATVREGTWS